MLQQINSDSDARYTHSSTDNACYEDTRIYSEHIS